MQLGPGSFVDPATGLSQVRLPDDAIDSVTVLPNPYAVEFGRFSSGLVLIQTRRAARSVEDAAEQPRPDVPDRARARRSTSSASRRSRRASRPADRSSRTSCSCSRRRSTAIARTMSPSRPQDELQTSHRFSSFTRVDANLSPAAFARRRSPASSRASHRVRDPRHVHAARRRPSICTGGVNTAAVTERALWSDTLFSETTVEVNSYRTDVPPAGRAPMELLPENDPRQFLQPADRDRPTTYPVHRNASRARRTGAAACTCTRPASTCCTAASTARARAAPVLIRRLGRHARAPARFRRADRAGDQQHRPRALRAGSACSRPTRWYVEFGARLDRDGVIDRFNLTPRVGVGAAVERVGQRGPPRRLSDCSSSGRRRRPASFDAVRERHRHAVRGRRRDAARSAAAVPARRSTPDLRTSRSLTWDLAYDHRFNPTLGAARRRHRSPRRQRAARRAGRRRRTAASCCCDSDGRSRYREAEVGVHFTAGHARRPQRLVRPIAGARRPQCVHDVLRLRAVADRRRERVRAGPGRRAASPAGCGAACCRRRLAARRRPRLAHGLPYSVVNEALDFVGPRNGRAVSRPTSASTSASSTASGSGSSARGSASGSTTRFNAFLPSDVQANITSPAFGTFYNSEYRQFRIQVRFER